MEGTQEVTKPPQSILQQPNPKLRSKFCKHFYLHVGMRPLCKFKEAVSVKCAGKGDTRRGGVGIPPQPHSLLQSPGVAFDEVNASALYGVLSLHSLGYYKESVSLKSMHER